MTTFDFKMAFDCVTKHYFNSKYRVFHVDFGHYTTMPKMQPNEIKNKMNDHQKSLINKHKKQK